MQIRCQKGTGTKMHKCIVGKYLFLILFKINGNTICFAQKSTLFFKKIGNIYLIFDSYGTMLVQNGEVLSAIS